MRRASQCKTSSLVNWRRSPTLRYEKSAQARLSGRRTICAKLVLILDDEQCTLVQIDAYTVTVIAGWITLVAVKDADPQRIRLPDIKGCSHPERAQLVSVAARPFDQGSNPFANILSALISTVPIAKSSGRSCANVPSITMA